MSPKLPNISRRWLSVTFLVNFSTTICKATIVSRVDHLDSRYWHAIISPLRSVEDSDLGWESDCNLCSDTVFHLLQDCENGKEIGLGMRSDFCSHCDVDGLVLGSVKHFVVGDLPEVILLGCDPGIAWAKGPGRIVGTCCVSLGVICGKRRSSEK